ncbi:hypothetical protein PHYPSEUDO_012239 [Phytophthora pseudosyringae]|uniref:Uncharacterized protein n=1 Tax=Phytophthora pseudosyringae TaxID=221518 RepID=A0A8T1VAD7_9STRA|nr:hypothetical protein PHYPSEUDO_012239 [Phytophthora pseudosyringae]
MVPGTQPSSPDVDLDAQSVATPDTSASDAGPRAVAVTGIPTASQSVVSSAQSVSRSDYGSVDSDRHDFRSRLYASVDGGLRPLSGRCAFAWGVWSSDNRLIRWQATMFLASLDGRTIHDICARRTVRQRTDGLRGLSRCNLGPVCLHCAPRL